MSLVCARQGAGPLPGIKSNNKEEVCGVRHRPWELRWEVEEVQANLGYTERPYLIKETV